MVLALVSAAVLFGVLYAADAEFLAGAISRLTGRHVEIGRVTVHLGRRLELELEQVKISDPNRPGEPPVLEVGHARGLQAWPRLLAGQYLPLDWTLDSPLLRIRTGAAAGGFDLSAVPRLGLQVSDGRVELTTDSGESWSLAGLQLRAQRAGFGTRIEGEGSARLSRGESLVSELALRFSAGSDRVELRGNVAGLDLATLPKVVVTPRGRGEGNFELTLTEASLRGRVNLDVHKLALQMPKLSGPIAPATARVSADFDWRRDGVTLDFHPFELDDLVVTGKLRVGTGRKGRLVADLRLAPFEPGKRDRVSGLTFLALRFASWARVKSRIEAGVAEDIRLAVDVPTATAAESLGFDSPQPPEAFVLQLRVRDGRYRPKPDESPIENLQGELEIRGEVMEIRRMRMINDGEATPEINVHLDGMHRLVHLPDAEDHVTGGPGVDLLGLSALGAALRAGEKEATEPTVVRFSDLSLRMPQLVLPLRQAEGSLRFPDGGLVAEGVRGVLGGAPAEVGVTWTSVDDRVDVNVKYLEGAAKGGPETGPRWLSAKVEVEELELRDWPVTQVRTRLSAERGRVTLDRLRARVAGGDLKGSGHLDLSQEGKAPFDLDFVAAQFDAQALCATFGFAPDAVTGRGHVTMKLSGVLRPGGDFRTEGALDGKLILKDGTVGRLPTLVAIARVPSLRGVTGLLGTALPYRTVEVDLSLASGKFAIADGKLLGPELRILGSGELDFNTPQRDTDMVVALLFLQTLDRVLDQLPLVRNVVLGDDKNLIAVYLRLQGPRDDITVTPLPPQRVSSIVGFASSAVVNGVKSLGRLMQPGEAAPQAPPEATPAPSPPQP